ncbi:hypothetical protein TREES_T100021492 [Tupaia chinensis]|uniref:Uncharacterized protein n=1 Tax=Tupaia chinensis TaxID=246437 RepID=L9KMH2_TUPCH|nr:hypothetical protein TREES_T100021492 [Tupaia chinensis]
MAAGFPVPTVPWRRARKPAFGDDQVCVRVPASTPGLELFMNPHTDNGQHGPEGTVVQRPLLRTRCGQPHQDVCPGHVDTEDSPRAVQPEAVSGTPQPTGLAALAATVAFCAYLETHTLTQATLMFTGAAFAIASAQSSFKAQLNPPPARRPWPPCSHKGARA